MDNNFSAQVKEIISYSREEALRLGNDFIGTEHLVLGLIRDGENTAIKILKSLNVDLYELRKEIELAVKDKTGKNIANISDLSACDFTGATLKEADLRGCQIDGMRAGPDELRGAIVDEAQALALVRAMGITVK